MGHRIGLGYDVHPFATGRALVLGGVTISHPRGLAGHSDGDAVCHAVADALLGAFALGDMGRHFPDTEPRWRDANSMEMLSHVASLIAECGGHLVNADITVIADEPKLAPHVQAMREKLATALDVSIYGISIKATRTEGMGPLADGKGLAAQAVVLATDGADD
jgi:2-C-methyl-D-erythritol 2,4-cyclodiphosphate synthase